MGALKICFFFGGGKLTIRGSHHWESLEYAKHIPLILMSLLSSIIITIHHCHYQLASHDVSLNVCDLFIYLMFTHTHLHDLCVCYHWINSMILLMVQKSQATTVWM